jgi:hypothetical protein
MGNTCPHCGNAPCLPAWRKLMLGPSGSAPCLVCGKCVSVDRVRSTLVILPVSLYIVSLGTGWLKNLLAAVAIFMVMLPICALLYMYWVPLTAGPVRDANNNPRFR